MIVIVLKFKTQDQNRQFQFFVNFWENIPAQSVARPSTFSAVLPSRVGSRRLSLPTFLLGQAQVGSIYFGLAVT